MREGYNVRTNGKEGYNMGKESSVWNKRIIGVWRDDPAKLLQDYAFRTWAEALDFCKRNRETFSVKYHDIF